MKKIITLLFLMALVCVKGWGQTTTTTYTLTTSTTPAVTGNVTAANASIGSGISSQFTNNSTYGIGGGSWPSSTSTPIPGSSTKYLQFSITPSAGYTLNISSLTLRYANNEFSFNDGLAIFYSTSSTFATSTQVFASSTYIGTNSGTYSNSAVNASAGAGQTLYFRVYFYAVSFGVTFGDKSISLTGTTTATGPTLSAGTLASFGNVCQNTTSSPNSFTLTGSNLTGNVTVNALTGYTYSTTSGGTYSSTLTLTPTSGAINQTVYVEFSPTAVQSYNGNISISGGGATSINVAASGSGVNSPPTVTAGTATSITLTSANVPGTITVTGCSAITAYGVEYSTTSGFANGTGTAVAGSNLSNSNFSVTLTGLTQSTTYYYHTYATNSGGTSYSAQGSFTTASPTIATGAISSSTFCVTTSAGAAVSVPFTSTGTFGATNTYTAQLSSASGSFTSPVAIGTLTNYNSNSGTISATIPANTATGTAYRIRVIASSPATTGTDNGTNLTINLAANSIAPTTAQNISVNANGTTLTVTEQSTATSRIWYYSTTSGGPYTTSTGVTTTTYTPNFATQGTYYVVCVSTFACGTATSNQVQINVSATITTGTITGSPFCAAAAVNVPFTSAGTFSGNTYTAQLSDASGSFSSPTAIGTLVSNANSGTISGTIPATAASGSAYLIRVVSSSPAATGSNSSAITINAAPTITAFTASPTTLCLGSSTNLNATSPTVTQSGFAGVYAPANWTLSNNPSNVGGSVNSSSAPTSISFKGGNSGTGGYTDYTIGTIAASRYNKLYLEL